METGFIAFLLLIVLGVVIALVVMMSSLKGSLKQIGHEIKLLSMRLDYLRRELEKLAAGEAAPGREEPAARPAPPLPGRAPEQAVAAFSVPVPKAARKPAALAGPPPLPQPPPPVPAPPPRPPAPAVPHPALARTPAPAFEKAAPAEERSKLAESVEEILGKIWNWIIVGEEHRPAGVTAEYAVATTWLLRLSVVAIVGGMYYFLRWSIDKGCLVPTTRVAMSMVAGVGMLIFGARLLGRKYHLIGQGMLGGGLLVLYISAYALGPRYMLLGEQSTPAAYALMILITVTAGILSVKTDSLLIAVLGIAGGYTTPVMLRTATPNLLGLYSYVLMLGLGILGIAQYKQWRLLNYLGFVFTYGLAIASLIFGYDKSKDFVVAISFVSVFFVIQSWIVYANNIVRSRKSTVLEIIHLVANALVYAGIGYWLIDDAYHRPYPALMSLGLAVFYIAHVLIFLQRRLADRPLLISLIALAGAFTTWTLPLIMENESLTIAFSLLAFMFLWIGRRLNSNFVQNLGYAVYMLVFWRLLFIDFRANFSFHPSAATPMAVYWKEMAGRLWTFGVSIGSILAAFFLQRRKVNVREELAVSKDNDTPGLVGQGVASGVFYWFALLFAFLVVHAELNSMFVYYEPLRPAALTLLWCIMGVYFLARYLVSEEGGPIMFAAMCIFLVIAVMKVFAVDLATWKFCERLYYDMEYAPLEAGIRFLDFGFILALFLLIWWMVGVRKGERSAARAFGYGGLLLLFIYASLELNSFLHWKLPDFQAGGMSVLWALFAIAFVSGGIWKDAAPIRYAGLALFCTVALKVPLVDLKHMETIYRVIAFMVIGVLLLLGSFAYIYSSRKFLRGTETGADGQGGEGTGVAEGSEQAKDN